VDFEATSVIRNSYNLAISNVPFGDYKLRDQSGYMSRLGLPDMVKNGDCLIHDFSFEVYGGYSRGRFGGVCNKSRDIG